MPKWICPVPTCDIWAFAPSVRPVHARAANPFMQAKDPHCPKHGCDLEYTPDGPGRPMAFKTAPVRRLDAIGTVDKKLGILVAVHADTVPIYCDYHQRKHVYLGNWPGQTPTDKPVFLGDLFSQSELTLCKRIAAAVPWGRFEHSVGGIDIIFDCGRSIVGTAGETDILVQGGWQKEKDGPVITFHAYPIADAGSQANTFKSCKRDGRYLRL